jgi:hypothetical protein
MAAAGAGTGHRRPQPRLGRPLHGRVVSISIDLEAGTDFADLFEVKDGTIADREIRVEHTDREVVMGYRNAGLVRETRIAVNADVVLTERGLRLNLWLAPREQRTASFVLTPVSERHKRA